MGKKVYFITNNSTKTRNEFLEKAKMLNFNVGEESMISTAYLTAQYLKQKNFNKKVYIIGTSGISKELDLVGIRSFGVGPDLMTDTVPEFCNKMEIDKEVGAVVVGFDEHISFPKLIKASTFLANPDTLFLGTNPDERFPIPNFVLPGTGAVLKCIETGVGRKAKIIGKPYNLLCEIFFKDEPIKDPKRYLMIGDRLNTDILFGNNNNYYTMLVETGIHQIDAVQEIYNTLQSGVKDVELENQIPDFYIPKLGGLFDNFD